MTLVKVKICGITNLDDALCAVDAGADMLGFIFYPPSPRSVTVELAREIVSAVNRQSSIVTVGVFVNETPEHMLRVVEEVGLDAIQLSGREPPETLLALNGHGYKVVRGKLWSVEREAWSEALSRIRSQESRLPDLLLEADHQSLYGGTGTHADEALAVQLAREYRLLLAGGLNPNNVVDAIRAVRPWGVDVASGVEASPGKKDHTKVRAFIATAKSAD